MKKKMIILSIIFPIILSSCAIKKDKTDKPALTNNEVVTSKNEINKTLQNNNDPAKTSASSNEAAKDGQKSSETNKSTPKDTNTKSEDLKTQEKSKLSEVKVPSVDLSTLDTKQRSWFFESKNDGTPSGAPKDVVNLISKYYGYYLGDTSKKYIYLTFDEGYENGYTSMILDTLKKNNVKATFFVVASYISSNKELVKRMVDEGHVVGSHSVRHLAMDTIHDEAKFNAEFSGVEKIFEEVTGKKISKFFRPPMGSYSEQSLYRTAALGYRSIFWSFAYVDWDPQKQPTHEDAKKQILQRTHNGEIILLHPQGKTNAEILDELIKEWTSKGYEFKTLEDLPS